MDRTIKFWPSKRFPALILDALEMGLSLDDTEHMTQAPPVRYWPPRGANGQEQSAPYQPKTSWADQWDRESDNADALDLLLDGEQP